MARCGSARSNQPGIDLLYAMNHHRDNLSQCLHALISQSITSQVMTTLEYGTMLFLTTILLDRVIGALSTRHRRLSHVLANLSRIDIAKATSILALSKRSFMRIPGTGKQS